MEKSTIYSDGLKMCHVNCQSLMAHLDEFRLYFMSEDYHIICMSETWLRPAVADAMVVLPGYALHRYDREGRLGGGVAFYLSDALRATVLDSSAGTLLIDPNISWRRYYSGMLLNFCSLLSIVHPTLDTSMISFSCLLSVR